MKNLTKRFIFITIGVLALAAGVFALTRSGDTSTATTPTEKKPVIVQTALASTRQSVALDIATAGTVESESEAKLVAEVSGTVTAAAFDLGKSVWTGQTLVRIYETGGNTDVQTAALALANAKKQYSYTKRQDSRDENLASENTKDQAKNDRAIAELNYQAAVKKRNVRSPISGTVTAKYVSVGDTVTAGSPLATVSRGAKIIRFYVNESQYSLLSFGQSVSLSTQAIDGVLTAKIARIAPSADPESRRFLVEATGTASDLAKLASGSVVNVTMQATKTSVADNYFVPLAALSLGQNDSAVLLAVNGTVKRQVVTVKNIQGELAEISGIAPSDQVILTNVKRLRDGDAITLE